VKLSWLLTFNAVVAVLFGITAVLLPGALYSVYGLSSTAGAQFVMQLFGSTLIAEGLITWGLRNIAPGDTRRTLTLALFIEALIGLVASLLAELGGIMNPVGWTVERYPRSSLSATATSVSFVRTERRSRRENHANRDHQRQTSRIAYSTGGDVTSEAVEREGCPSR